MDRKGQRIEQLRNRLRDLIKQQQGVTVEPKDITNTHRSRAPFQFVFTSDDPKQPKVSIASISQPDFDYIMRLIQANRLKVVRIDESSSSSSTNILLHGIERERIHESPMDTEETSISPSPIEAHRQQLFNRTSPSSFEDMPSIEFQRPRPPILPGFSTLLPQSNDIRFSQMRISSTPTPGVSHSRSVENLFSLASSSSAMALDGPTDLPGVFGWNEIHKDLDRLRVGAAKLTEDLGIIQIKIEELSKLEREANIDKPHEILSQMEQLRAENITLKAEVEALKSEKREAAEVKPELAEGRIFYQRFPGPKGQRASSWAT